jgi:DNA replication and repair protein RecF
VHLTKLELFNFKNYNEVSIELAPRVNCLLGKNGSGKTNLLDAIYYLSFTKSFLNPVDTQNIRNGEDYFLVRGHYLNSDQSHEVASQVFQGQKRVFREDGVDYNKLSDHIGKYPVVLISPSDIDLIKEGSEVRRKFFDGIISQIDHSYLLDLVAYQHCLKQRNGLLKMFYERQNSDLDLLDSYDQTLVKTGQKIFNRRREFITEFLPLLNASYNSLVENGEETKLNYQSQIVDYDFYEALKKSYPKDLVTQRTGVGIHRDDYSFSFAHGELKRLGSQGQQKTFLVALKLANLEVLAKHKGFRPILLLDDIFDKLDDHRIARLLHIVTEKNYGQLFITDAGPERTEALLSALKIEAKIFSVENGTITKKK